jgi:hypothetical protein
MLAVRFAQKSESQLGWMEKSSIYITAFSEFPVTAGIVAASRAAQ